MTAQEIGYSRSSGDSLKVLEQGSDRLKSGFQSYLPTTDVFYLEIQPYDGSLNVYLGVLCSKTCMEKLWEIFISFTARN